METGFSSRSFLKKLHTFDPDLENRVLCLHSTGMSTKDLTEQLKSFYGVEVSPGLISAITNQLADEVTGWQSRALEDVYAKVFMHAIHYKVRHEGEVITKAAYACLGSDFEERVAVDVDKQKRRVSLLVGRSQ